MTSGFSLDQLSTELLIKIFSYVDIKDLCHLIVTCKRFKEIISTWDKVIVKFKRLPAVTNQTNEIFLSRCFKRLNNLDKLRISKNWQMARYCESNLLYSRKKYIPYLKISDRFLWMSRGDEIKCYQRNETGIITEKSFYTLKGATNADIVNFQLRNNLIVGGLRDGTMRIHDLKNRNAIYELDNWHHTDINSVDIDRFGCIIVSGERNGIINIVKILDGQLINDSLTKIVCPDRIWKISLSDENKLAVGTSGNEHPSSLFIYDITRQNKDHVELFNENRVVGSGILDIRWDGPQILWTCGYDSVLKRWDLRTGKSEQNFFDPFGSVLYCLDYDYVNTIMTGVNMHGRIVLWDIRQRRAVQMYYMESCRRGYNGSSPVYSLAFDSEFLFSTTDKHLNVLNFSSYDQTHSNDYTFFF
ncbi:F-box/WD repeat-containing protein 4 [Diorhabda carinulata]|uniref:F-box/WD repeat-containing protein 4 n=1 Tax=Diorhabda carinulata TaxID=1163345 RepID=UPI0025A175C3|nr:F-box/WD repeat-containing protein 4 [Diorhabda carinulata]